MKPQKIKVALFKQIEPVGGMDTIINLQMEIIIQIKIFLKLI
jgi:hypothetical protein